MTQNTLWTKSISTATSFDCSQITNYTSIYKTNCYTNCQNTTLQIKPQVKGSKSPTYNKVKEYIRAAIKNPNKISLSISIHEIMQHHLTKINSMHTIDIPSLLSANHYTSYSMLHIPINIMQLFTYISHYSPTNTSYLT